MMAADIKEGGYDMIKEFQRRWSEIGYVPIKQKEAVQKKYKEAAAAIEKAIAMFDGNDTESVEVLHHAGDIYLALGDKLQAKLYWLRALKALKDMEVQMKIKNESEIKQIQNKLNKLKEKSEK